MNRALALEQKNIGLTGLDELLTLVGLPSKRSARELSGSADKLFSGITEVIDDILRQALDARTAIEFTSVRSKAFGKYFKTVCALSALARVMVPRDVIGRLVGESFCELEAIFRDEGLTRFGTVARDQAMFTVWTLRKTSRLASQIANAGPVSEDLREKDAQLASEFAIYAAQTQFNLDCMTASVRFDTPINPDVLSEICDGLRGAVNAYGLIRQGVDLRIPRSELAMSPYEWDDEDQELLDSSMSDMESELL